MSVNRPAPMSHQPSPRSLSRSIWRSWPMLVFALGVAVLLGRIVVGAFGIEDIESTLDTIAQLSLVPILVGIVSLLLLILVETLATPDWVWHEAGQNRVVWVLVWLFCFIGPFLYVLIARPQLQAAARRASAA